VKFGKKPARLEAYRLHLADYLPPQRSLPPVPANFGHDGLIPNYGMLANDSLGDCVIAGGLHETMLWNAEAARTVPMSDSCAIQNYSAITGYDPSQTQPDGSNPTDQGTDVTDAAKWRITNGLLDAVGVSHKVAAFVFVNPLSILELRMAAYIFGAVGIGLDFPQSAEDQFAEGLPWTVVPGSPSLGGHYVPLVGWRSGYGVVVTWGREQLVTPEFITHRADEAIAYLSPEMLNQQLKTPEGLDMDALRADLATLEAQ
jgi:hypothetical protein